MTYTDQVATISGTARNPGSAGEVRARVVVFPVDRTLWMPEPLNWRSPTVQPVPVDGTFAVRGVLPGEYLVAAVDADDVPEIADEVFLAAVAAFASRITVTAGQTATMRLSIGRVR
jgi:hypothetical protein